MPLLFVMKLQHRRPPLRVVRPEEVRRVSVLTATGLIEAEIEALDPTARYAASPRTTVLRITDDGLTEIRRGEACVREHLDAWEPLIPADVT
ncbi:hypothetical protein [Variovorax paradoxus]|uniref:hypothetical protein n=1 Tax=Variovorax paradoxus TaxID=34073 RepID=UPI00247FE158|nr:hypothetical protein [Variovorax paradoxus]WGT62397.1 hypothetical protein QHG62_20360 [Variovorax paradoxus]